MDKVIEYAVLTFIFILLWIFAYKFAPFIATIVSRDMSNKNFMVRRGFFSVFSASTSTNKEAEFINDDPKIIIKKVVKFLRIISLVSYVLIAAILIASEV